jgi:rhombotail lipoprotein
MKTFAVILLAAAAASGCASHWAMGEPARLARSGLINDPKQVSFLEKTLTDGKIAMMLDADVRAKLPTCVAIAAVPACGAWWDLADIGAEELTQWQKAVMGEPLITGVQPISPLVLGGGRPSLHDLRAAAARMNCELLLVCYRADTDVDNYNDAAALYWTFVGLWLVPGNVYEHRTVVQAILVDTRTGAILGTATGDKHMKGAYPAALGEIERGKLAQETPKAALADLQKACPQMFRHVVAAAERAGR